MASEFALIEHLLRRASTDHLSHPPILGPGDDCALIAPSKPGLAWAVTTDMLVAGVHFLASDDPHDLGWKTLAVNLSDLAAMGATPRYVTLAAAITPEDASDTRWIDRFFSGFMACATEHEVALIGGDTTRGPRVFSVTALGEVAAEQALRRAGAKDGDDIWVSGTPGYASLGLQAKLGQVVLQKPVATLADQALHHPLPRVALGLALNTIAHSAIDISDGLIQDLGHIAQASTLTATLHEDWLPPCPLNVDASLWRSCLLGGGDDYELAFTAAPGKRDAIGALSHSLSLPLTRIGRMQSSTETGKIAECAVRILDAARNPIDLSRLRTGFDHFSSAP